MTLVTADTKLLASGVIGRNPAAAPALFIDAWSAGLFELLLSEHILTELARTLATPYFRRYITAADAAAFITLLNTDTAIVPLTASVRGVATRPEDDLVLATAVSGQAHYLVTGDVKLQRLGSYQGVAIATPRRFVDEVIARALEDLD